MLQSRKVRAIPPSLFSRLLLAETIEPHDLGSFARRRRRLRFVGGGRGRHGHWRADRGRGRGGWQLWRRRFRLDGRIGRLELQAELHRWIEEALDRMEWHH